MRLREVLVAGPETRGVDRILATSFWCASVQAPGSAGSSPAAQPHAALAAAPIANVYRLPVRRP